jgi:hypothetical protein
MEHFTICNVPLVDPEWFFGTLKEPTYSIRSMAQGNDALPHVLDAVHYPLSHVEIYQRTYDILYAQIFGELQQQPYTRKRSLGTV